MHDQDRYKKIIQHNDKITITAFDTITPDEKSIYFTLLMNKLAQVLFANRALGRRLNTKRLRRTHPRIRVYGGQTLHDILGMRVLLSPKAKYNEIANYKTGGIRLIFKNAFISGIDFIKSAQFRMALPSQWQIMNEIPTQVWHLLVPPFYIHGG